VARAKPIGPIEIHEQEWFPTFLRDQVTDALQFILNAARIYQKCVSRLPPVFRACGTTRVLDLCSGGSGPWPWMRRALDDRGLNYLQVFLTDKYPNQVTVQKIAREADPNISYIPQPVDAPKVPVNLAGFRTMFSSFHHFDKEQAVRILQNAVDDGEGIAIFEVARPRLSTMALTSLMLFAGACHTLESVPGARGLVGPPLDDGIADRSYLAGELANTPETWCCGLNTRIKWSRKQ
jgi:hypothetical protein